MIHFFSGTDRKRSRTALDADVKKHAKGARVIRITDANSLDDLRAALAGGDLFGEKRVLILDGVFDSEEMAAELLPRLPDLQEHGERTMIYHSAPSAALRKVLEKHAEKSERFDLPKQKKEDDFFALPNALRAGKKKELWVGLQREFIAGKAPEAIHGALFWGAKNMLMKARDNTSRDRGARLIATLAELPHEARRRGEDLEYALERFVLSQA